jgi:hypothetical protein
MRNTSKVGEISIAQVTAAVVRAGKSILLPFGDHKRYDLVVEENDGRFLRVQCKTGKILKGVLWFPTCSIHPRARTGRKTTRKSYQGQVELFGVFCPDNDKVYLVPVKDVPQNAAFLRIEPPKNNQKKRIRWATDYEVGNAVGKELVGPG